jgi:two-component system, chemotaxis family, protein-glutamate methylesterase/glutaminase
VTAQAAIRPAPNDPIRVMLVDDSAVIRGLMGRWIKEDPGISVVGTAGNGLLAINQLERCNPEVIVLDIEMPEMDGLTALPLLLKASPKLKIIMASTLTLRNADISFKALTAGAVDYLPKPTSMRDGTASADYQRNLLEKIKVWGQTARGGPRARPASAAAVAAGAKSEAPRAGALYGGAPVVLRKISNTMPRVLAIGSSTGGPQALFTFFGQVRDRIKLPILLTQHMPPNFTTILAEHLKKIAGIACAEAIDGEPLLGGRVYVAPGDWHMTVRDEDGKKVVRLDQKAPENFCRPAVDPMFRSLAETFGAGVLAVVLTGMGHDGLNGGKAIIQAGGSVIAQDEASSVVWGMPGAVATNGLCASVLPIDQIGSAVERATRMAL